MKKEPILFIQHILECIEAIEEHMEDIDEKTFMNDMKTQDAVIRRIEIIGEAVTNIPESLKNEYPEIPWKNIIGIRNILIHHYFGVSLAIVWEKVQTDLPVLKKQMTRIKKDLEKS